MSNPSDSRLVSCAGCTYHVRGTVLAAWQADTGPWQPLGDELAIAGGIVQHFVHGTTHALATICAHPQSGTWWVTGAVRDKWYEVEAQLGRLGWPVEDERETIDRRGVVQHFGGHGDGSPGAIVSHPDVGTYMITPEVHAAWTSAGGESALGLPECDTQSCGDGRGRFGRYRGAVRSRIYWTERHGATIVPEPILAAWCASGSERSPLGYPIAGPRSLDESGCAEVKFERGVMRVLHDGKVQIESTSGVASDPALAR